MKETGKVTQLLHKIREGDEKAAEDLMPLVVDELRRLARHYMRNERIGHTLQPTALVNEAYLRMAGYDRMDWQSRSHFVGVAASVMRQVLVDHARRRLAGKRGAGDRVVSLEDQHEELSREQSGEILDLEVALKKLTKSNPRQARIVELRYFGGLSVDEVAEVLGISPITVKRDWSAARTWLQTELGEIPGQST